MSKHQDGRRSHFNGIIRIKKENIDWLKQIKKTHKVKTAAGMLDIIINYYRKNGKIEQEQDNETKST